MSVDLIKRMIEAGCPADIIAEVAILAGEAAALEKRRASDRERQAARRHVTSRDTADVTDTAGAPSLDKENSPRPPKEINLSPCVRTAREAGYHRLPEGWRPTKPLPPKTQAKVDEWPPGALDDELAALHRWAANAENKNGKGRKLDWDKAWVNWIERRHDERYRNANRGGGGRMGGPGPSSTLAMLRAANTSIARDREDRGGDRVALPAT